MSTRATRDEVDKWCELPLIPWKDTCATLHMWMQIVGKVRLALSSRMNHWWQVPLYVNAIGLTTSPIPYRGGIFEIQFDFIRHYLLIQTGNGGDKMLPLRPRSVAEFYRDFMAILASLGIEVKIWKMPVEVADPVPFDQDTQHASYDAEYANRFWQVLTNCDAVFKEFRARFIGKSSPSHFFWGSFDLAVTRFSGRRAPDRPDADAITREAYSHEVISSGWWPGGGSISGPAFYTYAVPEPPGFAQYRARPESAFYHPDLKEFLLMYNDVRQSPSPRVTLLDFLQSTYSAGADLGKWDRKDLEKPV
ncbi:MAG TPA: DUF5996 family protein [Acidobacteriaceae bacterium]|nr:DUF5996 family protein [Acidobacteriaceae bacterium]